MSSRQREAIVLLALLLGAVILAGYAPAERVLSGAVRIVYLHGAFIWAALLAFAAASLAGVGAFALRRPPWHAWSGGFARSGTVFWLTSLFLSLAAMQTSWNGLYLAEPRWQLAVRFAVVAVLLQAAAALLQRPRLASALNIVFFAAIVVALSGTREVMHPASPIFTSASVAIRVSFLMLLTLVGLAAVQLARLLRPHV